jgi:hypothetical protein
LTSAGTTSLSADTFTMTSSNERPTAFSIFFQGDLELGQVIFGDGLRCTGGGLTRLYTRNAHAGVVTAPSAGDPPVSVRSAARGDTIPGHGTRIYQVTYRDPDPTFCPLPTGGTFNASNSLRVTWYP